MKRQRITARICAFVLAASLIAADAMPAFAASTSEENSSAQAVTPAEDVQPETAEDSSAQTITPARDVQTETAEDSSAQTTTPAGDAQPETIEKPETIGNTESEPEAKIFGGTDDEPETSGTTKTEPEIPNETALPNSTEEQPGIAPAPQAEENQETAPRGLEIKDGLAYMDGALYTGYYMDAANILYIASNGVAEPVNGIINEGTPYYKLPSNERLTLQAQTVFVNGKIYSGYFMDSNGIMYSASNGAAALVTGMVNGGTPYYKLPSNECLALQAQTVFVNGKIYSGYFMDTAGILCRVSNGIPALVTGTLKANTSYYSLSAKGNAVISQQTLYVEGKVYSGYYLNSKNKMYQVKNGSPALLTGTLKANAKYYDYNKAKEQTLSKQTLYVKGKSYTGYYLNSKNKMYQAKEGSLTLFSGTLKAKTKYYDYKKAKVQRLSKQKLYVKGKLYTGYYMDSRNTLYRAKKGSLTPVSGILGAGTKYYSYKSGKTRALPADTLYVGGKIYTGYYMGKDNRMYHSEKGTCSLINATLNAGTRYYSSHAGQTLTLPAATVYVNGKVMEGMSPESLATLQRAQAVVASITTDSMSMEQKLRACFDYVKTYREGRPRTPNYTGMDWPVIYANDIFVNGFGNCCSYAAAFAYMAKAIGYEEVYCCNDSGHGWAEIDGLIYDPEWSMHHDAYSYYALSYDAKTDVDYKGNIAARLPWMHVKI